MKNELIPGLSAVMTEKEYLLNSEAMNKLPTVFILAENFTLYRRTRTAGGYSLSVFNKLPPGADKLPSMMSPGFSHLPGGKIPIELLSKIGSWFKDIAKETSDEAMAHILWNKDTQEYEIGIPTQVVAGASVDYTFDDVRPHHVIVLDIHSHNNMGSFWSGRDDKDDAKGIWISGVLGTLGTTPSISLRYSDRGIFIKTTFEEVFSNPFSEVDFGATYPKEEWAAKVSLRKLQPITSYKAQQATYDYDWPNRGSGSRLSGTGIGYYIGADGELVIGEPDPFFNEDGEEGYPQRELTKYHNRMGRFRETHRGGSRSLADQHTLANIVRLATAGVDRSLTALETINNLKEEAVAQVRSSSIIRMGGFTHPLRGLFRILPDYVLPLLIELINEEIQHEDRTKILHAGSTFKGGTLDRMQNCLLDLEATMSAIRYPTE